MYVRECVCVCVCVCMCVWSCVHVRVYPSVCPSIHVEQLGSHWMGFYEILYLSIFLKFVQKFQVSLKSDTNNRYFTWKTMYIYDNISLNSC